MLLMACGSEAQSSHVEVHCHGSSCMPAGWLMPRPPLNPPQVCNRVTGLLSPDPDAHVLRGALVYGSVRGTGQWRGGTAADC